MEFRTLWWKIIIIVSVWIKHVCLFLSRVWTMFWSYRVRFPYHHTFCFLWISTVFYSCCHQLSFWISIVCFSISLSFFFFSGCCLLASLRVICSFLLWTILFVFSWTACSVLVLSIVGKIYWASFCWNVSCTQGIQMIVYGAPYLFYIISWYFRNGIIKDVFSMSYATWIMYQPFSRSSLNVDFFVVVISELSVMRMSWALCPGIVMQLVMRLGHLVRKMSKMFPFGQALTWVNLRSSIVSMKTLLIKKKYWWQATVSDV